MGICEFLLFGGRGVISYISVSSKGSRQDEPSCRFSDGEIMNPSIRRLSVLRRRTVLNRATSRPLCEALELRQLLAADFESGLTWGNESMDNGFGVAIDNDGNTYVSGSFSGTIDLNPGPGVFNVSSGGDPASGSGNPFSSFVAKYDSGGNFVWARQLSPVSDNVFAYDVAITPSGEVFVGGGIEAEPNLLASVFISKLDRLGNVLWTLDSGTASLGTNSSRRVESLAADASGNAYAVGLFEGSMDFDGDGTAELQTEGSRFEAFVLKLGSDGSLLWARNFGGDFSGLSASGVAVDATGNVYTTGQLIGTADLDPGEGVFNLSSPNGGAFVQKLDSSGNFVWARSFSGGSGSSAFGRDLDIDAAGNVYSTGTFRGTVDFNPGAGTHNIVATDPADESESNVYISKLDRAGNFVWVARAAASSDLVASTPSIALDGRGNVFISAGFSGTGDFDQRPAGCTDILAGEEDVFILKLDTSGQYESVQKLEGTGSLVARDIGANARGDLAIVGDFSLTVDLDPGPGTFTATSRGLFDGFLLRLSDNRAAGASDNAKLQSLAGSERKVKHHKSPKQMRQSLKAAVKRLKGQIKAAKADGEDVTDLQGKLRTAKAALKKRT
jgi:hypothetical protein